MSSLPLFSDNQYQPLAERMRPYNLEQYIGQSHLLAEGKPLQRAIINDHLHSMLFWGPPGTGKTTLAKLISHYSGAQFITLSAVLAGVKDIRAAVTEAKQLRKVEQRATVLFVDEVHRFNKAQQDAFLPHIEKGTFFFIGATTENPSFELNNALLSRLRVYVLRPLDRKAIETIIKSALNNEEQGFGQQQIQMDEKVLSQLAKAADGDARRALNWLEIAVDLAIKTEHGLLIDESILDEIISETRQRFDHKGDIFYEQISALHKSIRGSNPDAALYWFCRMLEGGCDPLYIARRVVRIASEDIGNADPRALTLALNAWEVYQRLGSPEGELSIAQAIIYLGSAAKSNAVYKAYKAAMKEAKQSASLDVPMHLRNAPTQLMKKLDYGKNYRYAHDESNAFAAGESYFPDQLGEQIYYEPVNRGLEIKIAEKLKYLRSL